MAINFFMIIMNIVFLKGLVRMCLAGGFHWNVEDDKSKDISVGEDVIKDRFEGLLLILLLLYNRHVFAVPETLNSPVISICFTADGWFTSKTLNLNKNLTKLSEFTQKNVVTNSISIRIFSLMNQFTSPISTDHHNIKMTHENFN